MAIVMKLNYVPPPPPPVEAEPVDAPDGAQIKMSAKDAAKGKAKGKK